LHLVGYLYYWQMGFNSVFKGLNWGINLMQYCSYIENHSNESWTHSGH